MNEDVMLKCSKCETFFFVSEHGENEKSYICKKCLDIILERKPNESKRP